MRINIRSSIAPVLVMMILLSAVQCSRAGQDHAETRDDYYNEDESRGSNLPYQGQQVSSPGMPSTWYQPVSSLPAGDIGVKTPEGSGTTAGYNYEDSCKDCQKTWTD